MTATKPEELSLLLIGDVVGKPGRRVLQQHLGHLRLALGVDLVVANGENAAAGIGITPAIADELFKAGVDVITSGNHIWRYAEIHDYLGTHHRLLRPVNYPPGVPGQGYVQLATPGGVRVGVLNLLGRVFMDAVDCPFQSADKLLASVRLGRDVDVIVVDFHAEASSEKVAMAWHLDGRVSAVLGTHTHVPTADQRIFPRGTGFQCDLGMTGSYDSVIGMRVDSVMPKFTTHLPGKLQPADGAGTLCGALVRVHAATGRCRAIQPVRRGPGLAETQPESGH
ncbi:MAG: YmdB family metallophosphoesterase [Magnetococcales bacterium]|nr:YmdB family metallophosphoesterase [Magnetococcales bacterium]MBF0322591.1 YmdB family metallophosphoesterase [Magnetococcales bacterium]